MRENNINEYLEYPCRIEDTIENLKAIKVLLQKKLLDENYEGMGEKDSAEIGFDFDRALKAIEKQIPTKPYVEGDGYDDSGNLNYDTWYCPSCNTKYELYYEEYKYCPNCGQCIDL